ncbi:2-keto-4-pentenoate hydratase [Bradyrhizobium sp. Ce-3]|uniref:2-keto-4-pentenoate hydratase n=1 Tax=Bradyrhizobium sp. Ce-3 TaxID=2913970 RepID=UPI001FC8C852|nr:fumarylacetoacetate hydrolase family protein [Bradyrhizobium sp. Ce-3]GKQ52030.1 2-keto-4-pentenoate hydratase [Bradyrhizobium sp. Ce-3]
MTAHARIEAIANEVLASWASHSQIQTFSSRPDGITLAQAYQVTPLLRAAFEARGERITGRKIGFTNRQMWQAYGVDSPVWGYATSRTTRDLADTQVMALDDLCEPRIEPEIMFGIGAQPSPSMSDDALLGCIAWVALGYEIVQSIYPDWKFAAADTVAANGVHGALLIGTRHAIAPRKSAWQRELATFEAELQCDGKTVQRGGGALVLDSPLQALRHLVELLAKDPHNPPLAVGDVISTGTLTLPMPIKPGERWTAKAIGIPLEDVTVQFA